MPLVARKRAVAGVAAWTSVLRELLLTYAADDPGFREGGGRAGGDRGGGVLGDHHDPLHRRRVVAAPAPRALTHRCARAFWGDSFPAWRRAATSFLEAETGRDTRS